MTAQLGFVRVTWAHRMSAATIAAAGVLGNVVLAIARSGVDYTIRAAIPMAGILAVTLLIASRFGRAAQLRAYETAGPLAEPDAAVSGEGPARRLVLRRMGATAAIIAMVTTVVGHLLDEPSMPLVIVLLAVLLLARASSAANWERRRGVVLWQRIGSPQTDPATSRRVRPPMFTTPREATVPGPVRGTT